MIRDAKNGNDANLIKARLCSGLQSRLGLEPELQGQIIDRRGPLFEDSEYGAGFDEVDQFFETVGAGDRGCEDAGSWWLNVGKRRFPNLAQLARTVLMVMGSSVLSESCFSCSGHVVRSGRCRLTRAHILKMMQLQSWYTFTDVDQIQTDFGATELLYMDLYEEEV